MDQEKQKSKHSDIEAWSWLALESREIVIKIARSIENKAMEKESELTKKKQEEMKMAR